MGLKQFVLIGLLSASVINIVMAQSSPPLHENYLSNETEAILSWHPPSELQRLYPYFLSGVDKEGSPVNVFEFGRWDIRETMEKGYQSQEVKDFEKYTLQMFTNFYESPRRFRSNSTKSDKYIIIADIDGFDLRQFSHLPSVGKVAELARHFFTANHGNRERIKKVYIVNSNILFNSVYNIIKPIMGELVDDIVLYGTLGDKWKPILLKVIDKNQLPEWLGGEEDFEPKHIYG